MIKRQGISVFLQPESRVSAGFSDPGVRPGPHDPK